MTEIKQSSTATHCVMFVGRTVVPNRHVPSGKVNHSGTKRLVYLVKRCLTTHADTPASDNAGSARSSIGGQLQTKLRSPCAPSIRPTGGQILLRWDVTTG